MTFTISDLAVGDKIIFQNFDYYDVNQQQCSSNLICNANGII